MKLIKTRLRNALSDCSFSHLMKIAIEATEVLSDSDLDEIVNVWQRNQGESQFDGGTSPPETTFTETCITFD